MTRKLNLLAAAVATCAALGAMPSYAQLANSGLYIGGSIGPSRFQGDAIGGVSTRDRSDTGGKAHVGYEFTPNIALELGYADLGSADSAAGDVDTSGAFLDVVGKMPFTQQLSGIARVGAFSGRSDFTSVVPGVSGRTRSTQPKLGLGLQYDFTKNVSLRGEWERYRFERTTGSKANTDLATIGLNFRF